MFTEQSVQQLKKLIAPVVTMGSLACAEPPKFAQPLTDEHRAVIEKALYETAPEELQYTEAIARRAFPLFVPGEEPGIGNDNVLKAVHDSFNEGREIYESGRMFVYTPEDSEKHLAGRTEGYAHGSRTEDHDADNFLGLQLDEDGTLSQGDFLPIVLTHEGAHYLFGIHSPKTTAFLDQYTEGLTFEAAAETGMATNDFPYLITGLIGAAHQYQYIDYQAAWVPSWKDDLGADLSWDLQTAVERDTVTPKMEELFQDQASVSELWNHLKEVKTRPDQWIQDFLRKDIAAREKGDGSTLEIFTLLGISPDLLPEISTEVGITREKLLGNIERTEEWLMKHYAKEVEAEIIAEHAPKEVANTMPPEPTSYRRAR